jgi:hypothetical protein
VTSGLDNVAVLADLAVRVVSTEKVNELISAHAVLVWSFARNSRTLFYPVGCYTISGMDGQGLEY